VDPVRDPLLLRKFGSAGNPVWKRMKHLKNLEDGDSTFSETSVRANATRY
jgi:hypothetical protein